MKFYIGGGSLIAILSIFAFARSCIGSGNQEMRHVVNMQRSTQAWAARNTQIDILGDTILCSPRSYGKRFSDDVTYCDARTRSGIPLHLCCFNYGCRISSSNYCTTNPQ